MPHVSTIELDVKALTKPVLCICLDCKPEIDAGYQSVRRVFSEFVREPMFSITLKLHQQLVEMWIIKTNQGFRS